MINRPFWLDQINRAWKEAPVVWLAGVRRSGKTTLAQNLGGLGRTLYLDCDLPSTEEKLKDPEFFFRNCEEPIVIFDEIHQLKDPSRVLKIGADGFKRVKMLATGSSTLSAGRKFRDTLTGRKRVVHLLPVIWEETEAFKCRDIKRRLFHGGLPQALLSQEKAAGFYREWLDSFFARDIQKLHPVRDAEKFINFLEYLLRQSGGQLESSRAGSELGVSRVTVDSHLRILEMAQAVTRIRPFFGGGQKEIVKMPKIYGFDTGFVSFVRGWDPLRPQDYGALWEHVVLESLQAYHPNSSVRYWRDKAGREIDFILAASRERIHAIECKWDPNDFDPIALRTFRSYYPHGMNLIVSPIAGPAYLKSFKSLTVKVVAPAELAMAV